jgi:hypothetical protein
LILDSSSQDEAEGKGKRECLLLSLNVDNRELPENIKEEYEVKNSQKFRPEGSRISAKHQSQS